MNGTTVRRSPGRKGTPPAEPNSKLPQTVAEVLGKHVVLQVESIDRMYLNVIVRRLQILTALVNRYYFYCLDENFGPFFLKFCSYFPYNAKLCLNGHEYAKRQLDREKIAYQALENGIQSCANPKRLQSICDSLSADKIDALLRKWLRRLPHPFLARDRLAGYRYQISILQIELSLTQVLDRPVSGRIFFEDVIRENLDIGRPKQVQLIFDRGVTKTTPGSFRTRVITDGVIPSLHIDYKGTRIKQYHKEGQALRTETTINNTRDFYIGKSLCNLPAATPNRLPGQPTPPSNPAHHTRFHSR
jgi:hypothetical protein